MTSTIVHLPATGTMTPDQALHSALGLDLTDVLIVGYDQEGVLAIRSSRMTCADALWLAKRLELYALSGGERS